MRFTYLLIECGALLVPLLFSFHPRIAFYKNWRAFWMAAFFSAAVFIAWDVLYTYLGVWHFNPDYLTGITLINLPLEEWLFFLFIPYACVFTYHCFTQLLPKMIFAKAEKAITLVLVSALLITGACYITRLYTGVTFFALALLLAGLRFGARVPWMGRFLFTYLILLIPFCIVNGLLTGTGLDAPVVLYNDHENMGIRLLTIPLEDIFYGMLLILLNVAVYEFISRKKRQLKMS